MINFEYARAGNVADAVRLVADDPGAQNSSPAGPISSI